MNRRAIVTVALAPAAAFAVAGCTTRSLEKPTIAPTQSSRQRFQVSVNRDIDLLFMVDNSSSMSQAQTNLTNNFPNFIQVLSQIPDENRQPRLPDVHIGVITSDLGAGPEGDQGLIDGCTANGQGGVLQNRPGPPPVAACSPAFKDPSARWIEDDGKGTTNYTGALADTFSCIATTGATGCGLERQIQSVLRALGAEGLRNDPAAGPHPPQENSGFLRDDAYLGIILITNEDDNFSSRPGQDDYYDVTPPNDGQGGPLGPRSNYRGNHWSDLCDGPEGAGVMPRFDSPTGATGQGLETYTNCRSNESSPYAISVADAAADIKALKSDPSQILVAAITGPPSPYVVDWVAPEKEHDPPWPKIEHSCGVEPGLYADPAVRITQFVSAFGGKGLIQDFCAGDYGPALTLIARDLGGFLKPPCVTGALWDSDLATPGVQPDCIVTDQLSDNAGGTTDTQVPSCAASGGVHPCYDLAVDADNCPNGYRVDFTRDGPPPNGLHATAECRVCPPGINASVPPGMPPVDPGCP